jgi:hypothetical protein
MVDVRDNGDISQLADHNGLFVRDSGEAVKSRQLYRERRLAPCFLAETALPGQDVELCTQMKSSLP